MFGYVTTSTQVAASLTNTVSQAHVSPLVLFITINLLLIFLGCFWFGVIVVINMEMALIHPPVGLNLFVVQSVAPDVPLRRIVLGTLPYVLIMAAVLALVGVFPGLTSLLHTN